MASVVSGGEVAVGTGVLGGVGTDVGSGLGVSVGTGVGVSAGEIGVLLGGNVAVGFGFDAWVVARTPALMVAPTSGRGSVVGVGIDAAITAWIVDSMFGEGVSGTGCVHANTMTEINAMRETMPDLTIELSVTLGRQGPSADQMVKPSKRVE